MGFDPILIKLGCEVCIMIELCFPENGRAAPIMGGAMPKKQCFKGVAGFKLHLLRGGLSNLAGVSVFG